MPKCLVISGLVKKYQAVCSEIQHQDIKIAELKSQARFIGDAIKVCDPDYNIRTIAPKRYHTRSLSKRAEETQRLMLDCLRDTEKPLSVR